MKVTDLKNWHLLTPEEQARLKEMYNVEEDDELAITKTMAEKPPVDAPTPAEVKTENAADAEAQKEEGGTNA